MICGIGRAIEACKAPVTHSAAGFAGRWTGAAIRVYGPAFVSNASRFVAGAVGQQLIGGAFGGPLGLGIGFIAGPFIADALRNRIGNVAEQADDQVKKMSIVAADHLLKKDHIGSSPKKVELSERTDLEGDGESYINEIKSDDFSRSDSEVEVLFA